MGREVSAAVFSREDRQRYRQKVRTCLDVFARMLREARFDAERRSVGLEIELNLTDEAGEPAMVNARALEAIADADFQTELGSSTSRSTCRRGCSRATSFAELEEAVRREPQPRGGAGAHGGRAHDDDRDPADGRASST